MKKVILIFFFTINLFAEAQPYIGLNYGAIYDKLSTANASSTSQFLNLKAGYGVRKSYAVEIYLEYIQNRSKIFSSNPTTQYDGDKYAINVELVKSFDFDIYILPFIKAGFGAGSFKVVRSLDNKISYGSFNLGTGFYIPISKYYDIELGYRYKSISNEGLDLVSQIIVHTSNANVAYVGFNLRY